MIESPLFIKNIFITKLVRLHTSRSWKIKQGRKHYLPKKGEHENLEQGHE